MISEGVIVVDKMMFVMCNYSLLLSILYDTVQYCEVIPDFLVTVKITEIFQKIVIFQLGRGQNYRLFSKMDK